MVGLVGVSGLTLIPGEYSDESSLSVGRRTVVASLCKKKKIKKKSVRKKNNWKLTFSLLTGDGAATTF